MDPDVFKTKKEFNAMYNLLISEMKNASNQRGISILFRVICENDKIAKICSRKIWYMAHAGSRVEMLRIDHARSQASGILISTQMVV